MGKGMQVIGLDREDFEEYHRLVLQLSNGVGECRFNHLLDRHADTESRVLSSMVLVDIYCEMGSGGASAKEEESFVYIGRVCGLSRDVCNSKMVVPFADCSYPRLLQCVWRSIVRFYPQQSVVVVS